MSKVDANISDLFFNMDHDSHGASGAEYDRILREDASNMLQSLNRLGVQNLPSIDDLIADLNARS